MISKVLTLYFVLQLLGASQSGPLAWNPNAKRKPLFTIGKETTYVKGPIDKTGHIDYVAALNQEMSKGVKPKDNANILLWKALGPHPEGSTVPKEYFKRLGMKRPPEKGKYFDGSGVLTASTLTTRPWVPNQFPATAKWLKDNEKPLSLVAQASKRKKYYNPLVPKKTEKGQRGMLITALLSNVQPNREFAYALTARAMMRTGQKRYNEAWEDLIACHRLSRLISQGGTLIENLVGQAIDSVAAKSSVAYLRHAKLSAKQLKICLRDLQNLPPHRSPADILDKNERLFFLDCIMMLDRDGAKALAFEGVQSPVPLVGRVNWDPALKQGNDWYNRLAATMRIKDRKLRAQKIELMDVELKGLAKSAKSPLGIARLLLGPSAKGKAIGDVLVSLLFPAVVRVQQANERVQQIHTNLQAAFALAAYHNENEAYPKKLASLVPKYLPRQPKDLFSGKDLVYRVRDGGYLLYSVGVNEKDEGGRTYEDNPPGDDLRVRMSGRK